MRSEPKDQRRGLQDFRSVPNHRSADLQRLAELPRLEHLRLTLPDDFEIGALSALAKIGTLQTITVFTPIVSRQTECDAYLKNVLPGCEMISFYNHGRLSDIIANVRALGAESTPLKK